MTNVPFNDLQAQYAAIKDEVDVAIQGVIESQVFVSGPAVEDFEPAFSRSTGATHTIGVSSGTAAPALTLEAVGIGDGDEVIVPSMTFAATAEAVCHVGAIPVFADSDLETMTLSAASVRAEITSRTRAIVSVHLYGNPCDMGRLDELAADNHLILIEDVAQAHLATYGSRAKRAGPSLTSFAGAQVAAALGKP